MVAGGVPYATAFHGVSLAVAGVLGALWALYATDRLPAGGVDHRSVD